MVVQYDIVKARIRWWANELGLIMTGSCKNSSAISKGTQRRTLLLAPIAVLALSACATPFRADVQRFVALPDTTGQSFTVVASDPELAGGLEFAQYAALVEQRMVDLHVDQHPDD